MARDKKGHGSDGKFSPKMLVTIEKVARLGATDIEIADILGISVRTLYSWKHEHEGVAEALRAGKDYADERVERALYQRAVGYSFDSEKVMQYEGEIIRADTREHVPPDTRALEYWLNNRKGYEWKSKVEHEHSGTLSIEALKEASERAAKG